MRCPSVEASTYKLNCLFLRMKKSLKCFSRLFRTITIIVWEVSHCLYIIPAFAYFLKFFLVDLFLNPKIVPYFFPAWPIFWFFWNFPQPQLFQAKVLWQEVIEYFKSNGRNHIVALSRTCKYINSGCCWELLRLHRSLHIYIKRSPTSSQASSEVAARCRVTWPNINQRSNNVTLVQMSFKN